MVDRELFFVLVSNYFSTTLENGPESDEASIEETREYSDERTTKRKCHTKIPHQCIDPFSPVNVWGYVDYSFGRSLFGTVAGMGRFHCNSVHLRTVLGSGCGEAALSHQT